MKNTTATALLLLGLLAPAPCALAQELRSDTSVVVAPGETQGDIRVTSAAGSVAVEEGATAGNINARGGLVRIEAGAKAGLVSTMGGDIFIRERATVGVVSTGDGDVTIDKGATVTSVRSDSSPIVIGEDVQVAQMVLTRDGNITIGKGSTVGENVVSQEGLVTIDGATIKGVVVTTEGGVMVTNGAVLEGGLTVMKLDEKKPRGILNRSTTTPKPPIIVIGPKARVQGTLEVKGAARVLVHETAVVENLVGSTAEAWSGDEPPAMPKAAEGAGGGRTKLLK